MAKPSQVPLYVPTSSHFLRIFVTIKGVVFITPQLTGPAADLSLKGSPYWMAPEVIIISDTHTRTYAKYNVLC